MYVHTIHDQNDDIINNNNACRRQVIVVWKLKSAILEGTATCQASWALLWAHYKQSSAYLIILELGEKQTEQFPRKSRVVNV